MNDLPQNELLSAYLDGELTAGEQAEVERLLATNPAARQLLDELRTLGSVLQSLPQQKLGEDLSEQVLRTAKQRMQREEEPDRAASAEAPVPLPRRSIRERFINSRALVWAGLAVAIAVMIAVNERREQNRPANRELAVAPTASEAKADAKAMPVMKPAEPPEMRPLEEATGDRVRLAAKLSVRKHKSLEEVATDEKAGERLEDKMLAKKAGESRDGEEQLARTGAEKTPESPAAKSDLSMKHSGTWDAEQTAALPGMPPSQQLGTSAKAGFSHGRGMGKANDVAFGKDAGFAGKTDWKAGQKAGEVAAPFSNRSAAEVLVVYCDVSVDAVKRDSFKKLLDANGIVPQRQLIREGRERSLAKRPSKALGDQFGEPSSGQGLRPGEGVTLQRGAAPGKDELVYVEATPAQLKATLAGLEAQPNVFLSYSVKPAQEEVARRFLYYVQKERGRVESKPTGGGYAPNEQEVIEEEVETGAIGGLAANAAAPSVASPAVRKGGVVAQSGRQDKAQKGEAQREETPHAGPAVVAGQPGDQPQRPSTPAAEPQRVVGPSPNEQIEKRDVDQLATQPPPTRAPSQMAVPMQRVLFVLRVAGAPVAAAERQEASMQDSRVQDKAKAAAVAPPAKAETPAPSANPPPEHAPSK
jgi:negative regulator of sigma E activity